MSPKLRLPTYSLHRASGQARVRIDGRELYLGPFDSPESHRRYRELVDAWLNRKKSGARIEITVGQQAIFYLHHSESYYVKRGKQTSQVHLIRAALRPVCRLFRPDGRQSARWTSAVCGRPLV